MNGFLNSLRYLVSMNIARRISDSSTLLALSWFGFVQPTIEVIRGIQILCIRTYYYLAFTLWLASLPQGQESETIFEWTRERKVFSIILFEIELFWSSLFPSFVSLIWCGFDCVCILPFAQPSRCYAFSITYVFNEAISQKSFDFIFAFFRSVNGKLKAKSE